jgi:hypothetical protein
MAEAEYTMFSTVSTVKLVTLVVREPDLEAYIF